MDNLSKNIRKLTERFFMSSANNVLYMINFTKICQKPFLYTKWNTIICETSTKIAIFNFNGSFYNFNPNLHKSSFIHKISKCKALKRASFMYPKWKFASEIGHFVILPKLTENFLQIQSKQIQN